MSNSTRRAPGLRRSSPQLPMRSLRQPGRLRKLPIDAAALRQPVWTEHRRDASGAARLHI